jgi:hypothetical protein
MLSGMWRDQRVRVILLRTTIRHVPLARNWLLQTPEEAMRTVAETMRIKYDSPPDRFSIYGTKYKCRAPTVDHEGLGDVP